MDKQEFKFNDAPAEEDTDPMAALNQDFSLEDEYKEPPLIPQGNYQGNVTKVGIDPKAHCILFTVVLEGNGGVSSDGQTPVDGQNVWYRAWLPKATDATEMIKSGTMTKRQWKINALTKFSKDMNIKMDTPAIIKEALENGDWVGLRVLCAVGLDEYEGVVKNVCNKMKATKEEIPF